MTESTGYTEQHARSDGQTPDLETWPNQHADRDYVIHIVIPEFTAMCPKTGQPDFATITIDYIPGDACVELKSLKLYMQSFRQMGIFHENVINRMMQDLVDAVRPRKAVITGAFFPRGGISTTVRLEYPFAAPGTASIEDNVFTEQRSDHVIRP